MNEQDQDRLSDNVVKQLDREADSLDEATLDQLRQARYRALEELDTNPDSDDWYRQPWAWGGGLATACAAVLVLVTFNPTPDATPDLSPHVLLPAISEQAVGDLELLVAEEDIEFYNELEFYRWLEEEGLGAEDA